MTATTLVNSGDFPGRTKDSHPYRITEQWEDGTPKLYLGYRYIMDDGVTLSGGFKSTRITENQAKSQLTDIYRIRLFTRETTGFPDLWDQANQYIMQMMETPEEEEEEPIQNVLDIELRTPIPVGISDYLKDRIKAYSTKGGWDVQEISSTYNAAGEPIIRIRAAEVGSVTIIVLVSVIIGIIALVTGVSIWNYRIIRVSDNEVTTTKTVNANDSVQDVLDYADENDLSTEDTQKLILAIQGVYENIGSNDGSSTSEIKDVLQIGVYGALAVGLIGALKQ